MPMIAIIGPCWLCAPSIAKPKPPPPPIQFSRMSVGMAVTRRNRHHHHHHHHHHHLHLVARSPKGPLPTSLSAPPVEQDALVRTLKPKSPAAAPCSESPGGNGFDDCFWGCEAEAEEEEEVEERRCCCCCCCCSLASCLRATLSAGLMPLRRLSASSICVCYLSHTPCKKSERRSGSLACFKRVSCKRLS